MYCIVVFYIVTDGFFEHRSFQASSPSGFEVHLFCCREVQSLFPWIRCVESVVPGLKNLLQMGD